MKRHAKRQGAGNEGDFQDHDDPEWRHTRVRDLVRLHAQSAVAGDSVEFSTERGTLNAVSWRAVGLLPPWEIVPAPKPWYRDRPFRLNQ